MLSLPNRLLFVGLVSFTCPWLEKLRYSIAGESVCCMKALEADKSDTHSLNALGT